jgi:hypothetical protein
VASFLFGSCALRPGPPHSSCVRVAPEPLFSRSKRAAAARWVFGFRQFCFSPHRCHRRLRPRFHIAWLSIFLASSFLLRCATARFVFPVRCGVPICRAKARPGSILAERARVAAPKFCSRDSAAVFPISAVFPIFVSGRLGFLSRVQSCWVTSLPGVSPALVPVHAVP